MSEEHNIYSLFILMIMYQLTQDLIHVFLYSVVEMKEPIHHLESEIMMNREEIGKKNCDVT